MIGIIETMQIVNKQITEIARGVLILFQDPPAARIVAKAADQKVTWAFQVTLRVFQCEFAARPKVAEIKLLVYKSVQ